MKRCKFPILIVVASVVLTNYSVSFSQEKKETNKKTKVILVTEKPFDLFCFGGKFHFDAKRIISSYSTSPFSKELDDIRAKAKKDTKAYLEAVEKKGDSLPDLLQKAKFYAMAGGSATQVAFRLKETDPDLANQWYNASERCSTQAVIMAELAKAEAQFSSSSGMRAIGEVCYYRNDPGDKTKAIKAYKQAMMGRARLKLVCNHVNHWYADYACLCISLDAVEKLLRLLPEEQLHEVLVSPTSYPKILKENPNKGRKVLVTSPLSYYHDDITVRWLKAMAANNATPAEKEILLKAAIIMQKLRERESNRVRKIDEEKYPPRVDNSPFSH